MPGLAKGPIDHILRESTPPWRVGLRLTECGLSADNHPTLTRVQAVARYRELGQQRASLFTCMTCVNTAQRHRTWAEDPVSAMERETMGSSWARSDRPDVTQLRAELLAIAALIEAHRDEFDGFLAGLAETVLLADVRAERRTRRSRPS